MKRFISIILILSVCLSCAACGGKNGYGVKPTLTLVEQDYSLAFRNNDPIIYYVVAAIKVLAAEGKVDELAIKWFGSKAVNFESDASALDDLAVPENKTFIIGVDTNSFPLVYMSNGTPWGFDIELAIAVAERLGWQLLEQPIEKENVYAELASGNIDCAWGGIALDPKEIQDEKYTQYGPYIHNDIVIASRDGVSMGSLKGKTLAMPTTPEAYDALMNDEVTLNKLGNVIRLVGGTTECFEYLYAGKCDVILTDSTSLMYYNCH